jgi:hypothetical protein
MSGTSKTGDGCPSYSGDLRGVSSRAAIVAALGRKIAQVKKAAKIRDGDLRRDMKYSDHCPFLYNRRLGTHAPELH